MKKFYTHIVSYILVLVLCFSIYNMYDCFHTSLGIYITLGTILSTLLFFALSYLTEKHRIIGGILVMVCLLSHVQLYLIYSQKGAHETGETFLEWLLTKGGETQGSYMYMWVAYFFFASFFSVTVYYFSNVLYRMFFLTLACLIPAVVYLKVMEDMDNVFLLLIACLNVIIFMIHRRRNFQKGESVHSQNSLIASGTFILILFLITAAIPKNAQTPYYDIFEDNFLGGDTSSALSDSISELSGFSNDAGGFFLGFESSNRKLYTITAHNDYGPVIYLKRQVFDLFDQKKKRWYPDEYYNTADITPENYTENFTDINLPTLARALNAAESYQPGFLEKYGLEGLRGADFGTPKTLTLDIHSENFGAIFYLTPTQALSVTADDETPYFTTLNGAFRREKGSHEKDFRYSTEFYDNTPYITEWYELGGCDITEENYSSMLTEMHQILSTNHDALSSVISSYIRLDTQAMMYHGIAGDNDQYSPELVHLAYEITGGCKYDYQKALALVNYFKENDFVYDLQYRQKEKGPDYFLFESKRGSCSDYASAFTQLARINGLTVRYAEGYVAEMEESYLYTVKSRDSHAYPEVYLPGIGWTVFEPTVARMESMESHFSLAHFFTDLRMDYGLMGVIFYFIILGAILISVARFIIPGLLELIFRIRLRVSSPDQSALLAYNKIVRQTAKLIYPDAYSKTPYELACMFQFIGCDISELSFMLEGLLYADKSLTAAQKRNIPGIYANAYKAIRRFRKKNKSNRNITELLLNRQVLK